MSATKTIQCQCGHDRTRHVSGAPWEARGCTVCDCEGYHLTSRHVYLVDVTVHVEASSASEAADKVADIVGCDDTPAIGGIVYANLVGNVERASYTLAPDGSVVTVTS